MATVDDLTPLLKRLRLSGVLQTLSLRCQQAIDEKLTYEQFLYRLLSDEVERRDAATLQRRLRAAQFEQLKTLEQFDFSFNPQVPRGRIIELASCAFVERHQVVLFIGPAGTGKSHLAQALGHQACRVGYKVLFRSARQMLAELRAARADNSYVQCIDRLARVDLLIVDDVGLHPMHPPEPTDLYEVIRARYERGATIMTSNRAIDEWYPLFGDPLLAGAALDRLLHHAQIIELQGDSYRNPPPAKRAQRTVQQDQRANSSG